MKQLKFEHSFATDIQAGNKTATLRINDDKDIQLGDNIELVDKVKRDHPTSWEVLGILHITAITNIALSDLKRENFIKAESFLTIDEMIQVFRRFYGEHIYENTEVAIVEFSFSPYETPRKFLEDPSNGRDKKITRAKLYADGGSRGNPGPSASGFVVFDLSNTLVHADNKYLGITTNNQAEYHACLSGMRWCLKNGVQELDVYLDSLLVVNQMKGIFKVKNRDLWSLYETVQETAKKFRKISFTHVPRELNKLADTEVNKALNAVKGSDVVQ